MPSPRQGDIPDLSERFLQTDALRNNQQPGWYLFSAYQLIFMVKQFSKKIYDFFLSRQVNI